MAAAVTPDAVDVIKKVVHEHHLKFLVLGSLILQIPLLFLATYRKRASNPLVPSLVFGVHQVSTTVADVAFYFTVIAKWVSPAQTTPFGLWAAFMLLHLAGQNCLTACSLDDYNNDNSWLKFFKNTTWRFFIHFLAGMHQGSHLAGLKYSIFSIAVIRVFARTLRLFFAMWEVNGSTGYLLLDHLVHLLMGYLEHRSLSSSNNQHGQQKSSHEDDVEQQLPSSNNQHGQERDDDAEQQLPSSSNQHGQEKEDDAEQQLTSSNNHHDQEQSSLRHDLEELESTHSSDFNLQCVLRAYCLLKKFLQTIASHTPQCIPSALQIEPRSLNAKDAKRIGEILLSFINECYYADILLRYMNCSIYLIYAVLCCCPWLCCAIALITFLCTKEGYSTADYDATLILLSGTLFLEVVSYLMMFFSYWTIASFREEYGGRVFLLITPGQQHKHWPSDLVWLHNVTRVMFQQWSETVPRLNYLAYLKKKSELKLSEERYTDELQGLIFDKLRSFLSKHDQNLADDSSPIDVLKLHVTTQILDSRCGAAAASQEQAARQLCKLLSDYGAWLLCNKPQFFGGKNNVGFKTINEKAWLFIEKTEANVDFNQRLQTFWDYIRSLKVANEWADMADVIDQDAYANTPIEWDDIAEKWVGLVLHAAIKCDPIEHVKELSEGGQLISVIWLTALLIVFLN